MVILTPEYLLRISEGSEEIAEYLHVDIMNRLIERIMIRLNRGDDYILTSQDKWQLEVLQEAGYLLEDIQQEIAKRTNSPFIKVLADVAHMYVQNEAMELLREYEGIVVDAHTSNPDPDKSLDCKRIYPKKSDEFSQASFINELKAIGVEHCSIEANVLDFEQDVINAYEVLKELR